jgi:AraC-like DNA-binding protein
MLDLSPIARGASRNRQCPRSDVSRLPRRSCVMPDCRCRDVALACGFADQSHLTRVFTQLAGISPGACRRSLDQ